MAYNESLADRVRRALDGRKTKFSERKMFGGLAFMVRGHMAIGVNGDELMVRTGPVEYDRALKAKHARPMDFTGRPMKGMVFVAAEGLSRAPSVEKWVDVALKHNATEPAK